MCLQACFPNASFYRACLGKFRNFSLPFSLAYALFHSHQRNFEFYAPPDTANISPSNYITVPQNSNCHRVTCNFVNPPPWRSYNWM
jgi:hypothetical protein